ncbi:SDR family NAD(P)-dependent oxidoreductase [Verrucosispora sp. NA02020]|uniref:SDR family NAD(P)-dependent oxidoreductase n=1 Tax=Verrucosispora sp. NA02020 TaxID=2742132 RepID=UPI003D73D59E
MPTAPHADALRDAAVVLTGATSGIGRATALAIADRPGSLVLHGPEPESEVADLLDQVRSRQRRDAELTYVTADYHDLAEVTRLAERIRVTTDPIDVLINNAGRPAPATRTVSDAGNEITFQVDYLAPFLLTTDLIDLVAGHDRGRIVNIVSATHHSATLHLDDLDLTRQAYTPSAAYAHAKLALVTYTGWLARNRPSPSLDVVSLHPGVISTGLLHAMFSVDGQPPEQAADTVVQITAKREDNGTYYDERVPGTPHPQAADPEVQDRLYERTVELLRGHLSE